MQVALFAFITWLIIIIFSIIPKTLNVIENFIMFFLISIIELDFYTILTLNLNIVENSKDPKLFFAVLMNRSMVLPLSILTFVNLFIFLKGKLKKLGLIVITLSFLSLMDLLPIWLGMKVYNGWNGSLDALVSIVYLILFVILAKGLKALK